MRYVWLVALREFAENARTKGFWIGLLLFPVMLLAGFKLPRLLEEKALPTRYYILVDRSGRFDRAIGAAVEADHQRKVRDARKIHDARVQAEGEARAGSFEAALAKALPAGTAREIARQRDAWLREVAASKGGAAAWEQMDRQYDAFADLDADAKGALFAQGMAASLGPLTAFQALPEGEQRKAREAVEAWAKPIFREGEKATGPFEPPRRRLQRVDAIPKDLNPDDPATFRPYLLGTKKVEVGGAPEDLFALLTIPAAAASIAEGDDFRGIDYWCTNLTDDQLKVVVEGAIEKEVREAAYAKRSVSKEDLDRIQRTRVELTGKDPKKAAGAEKVETEDRMRQWAPVGAVYLLWVAIFTVAQMLLNNTTEEKSTRVIEVLLSSVTPGELMFGKLLGIAAVGLTMVGAWIGSFMLLIHYASGLEAKVARALMDTVATPELLAAFAGYFLLGYLLYAGIFLAMGSVVNSLKEAQNLQGPIMLVMMVPLLTMVFIARDPNGTLAVVLSWVPLYTPFVMMNRAAASPPAFDVVGTLLLLVASVAVSIWLSARIFRIGILRQGQPPKLLELFSWIRS